MADASTFRPNPARRSSGPPLLEVRNLCASFTTGRGQLRALDGVSFSVDRGERVALVGESGSGKSVLGLSLLGLVEPAGRVTATAMRFNGLDLLTLERRAWRNVRGAGLSMVFQDASTALNPARRIGDQLIDVMVAHRRATRREARLRVPELLAEVGLGAQCARDLPHRLSGGMRQRVMLALALCAEPLLVIADEPTTALDVTVQAQIMDLLAHLAEQHGTAVLLITHDLGIVAGFADVVIVLYSGRIVELAPAAELFARPAHPYSRALLAAARGGQGRHQPTIAGRPPDPRSLPPGCIFHPRCPHAGDHPDCTRVAPTLQPTASGWTACHLAAAASASNELR